MKNMSVISIDIFQDKLKKYHPFYKITFCNFHILFADYSRSSFDSVQFADRQQTFWSIS